MKKKIILMVGVFISLTISFFTMWWLLRKSPYYRFSEKYIMDEELPPLLSFIHENNNEWVEYITSIVKGKLNYKELKLLLKELGVDSYVTYQDNLGYKIMCSY